MDEETRHKIAALVCRKVDERLRLELDMFRGETAGAIEFQRHNHQMLMTKNVVGKVGASTGAAAAVGSPTAIGKNGFVDFAKSAHRYGYGGHPYHQGYWGGGYHQPWAHGYGYGYGYYGGPYGYTGGYIPKEAVEEEMVAAAGASTMSNKRTTSPGRKSTVHANYNTDPTVEFYKSTPVGTSKEEFVIKNVDPREEAQARRKAYDLHLKTDILYAGRNTSMNKTYDPYYHGDPRFPYHPAYYGNGYYTHQQAAIAEANESELSEMKPYKPKIRSSKVE